MRSISWLLLLGGCCLFSLGCGGTSQSDMMRHALKGEPEEEEEATPAPSQPPIATPGEGEEEESATRTGASPNTTPTSSDQNSTTEATADASAAASVAPMVEIPRPQTVQQRRQWTIDNLTKIGKAIDAYQKDKGGYPAAAITIQREPLLSWRVSLLPYLGYGELYQQFHRDESWDSIHNKSLLSKIPIEYQSPERFDEKTNYLGAAGTNLAFEPVHGRIRSDFEDGLINTVFVMEVDDALAVPWTQPLDYPHVPDLMPLGLGTLREDGFFVLWGSGAVGRIANDAPKAKLMAMLTIDTGDAFRYTQVHHEPTAEPVLAETAVEGGSKVADTGTKATDDGNEGRSLPEPQVVVESQKEENEGAIKPPSEEEKQLALETFRQLYEQRYKEAKTKEKKRELAHEIFDHIDKLADDATSLFVLLELIVKLAADAGDLPTALNAAEQLSSQFSVRGLDYRVQAIRLAANSKVADSNALVSAAIDALQEAIDGDDYQLAREMYGIASAEERKSNNGDAAKNKTRNPKLIAEKRRMDAGERGFRNVTRALKTIQTAPDDPASNRAIGEYFCLIKDQWERGLPFLAKGDNEQLAYLARRELARPGVALEYVEIADGWWDYGEAHSPQKRSCQLRAVYWYLMALQQGRSGLPALKAEVRLREGETRYGREVIDEMKSG